MEDVLLAVGLVLALEGVLYALFPDGMRRALAMAVALPPDQLRFAGLAAAVIGGVFLLVLDRVWPSPEHPSVALEGRAGRMLPALILALPIGWLLASVAVDWHMAAYAFALLAVLVVLNARKAGRTTRHELLGFLAILVLVAIEVRIPVRTDVMVFTAIVVAIVGAWRAERGTIPLWSAFGTLLVLIASVS